GGPRPVRPRLSGPPASRPPGPVPLRTCPRAQVDGPTRAERAVMDTGLARQSPPDIHLQGVPVTTATRVVPLVLGRRTITSASALLVLSAFFARTTLFLPVAAGAWMFFQTPPSPDPDLQGMDAMYKFLASFATILLIIPASTLASASATLSARRQDE